MARHNFKVQAGGRGLYAAIMLNVNFDKTANKSISIHFSEPSEWESTCMTGIYIFYDYYAHETVGRMEVTIERIDWMPVDTNNLIVLYGTILALSQELNYPLEGLGFDKDTELFTFPERRKSWNKNDK